ncbi:hypothetical protein BDY19DRAFT_1061051 [Irpex rosettiformis]|uniref:Uncharacterized protein n=1 Tax=Irpex rosettiformis TaxID=378272 RepID=A0ACB8TMJ5_9APHY|nr:hypothetical protein BDY19DRAFT_1061051 [Irpex rosettiformis]
MAPPNQVIPSLLDFGDDELHPTDSLADLEDPGHSDGEWEHESKHRTGLFLPPLALLRWHNDSSRLS